MIIALFRMDLLYLGLVTVSHRFCVLVVLDSGFFGFCDPHTLVTAHGCKISPFLLAHVSEDVCA